MSEYEQKNLFALFGNLRFRKNINQGGMGLGLTAANLICKVLHGNLNLVRSEKNNGSKFNFTMQVRLGSDIVYNNDNTSMMTDNIDSKSSPMTSTTKRLQTQSSAYNLNEMLLRQTSLCHLEKTLMESQQEFRFGHPSGEDMPEEEEEESSMGSSEEGEEEEGEDEMELEQYCNDEEESRNSVSQSEDFCFNKIVHVKSETTYCEELTSRPL